MFPKTFEVAPDMYVELKYLILKFGKTMLTESSLTNQQADPTMLELNASAS